MKIVHQGNTAEDSIVEFEDAFEAAFEPQDVNVGAIFPRSVEVKIPTFGIRRSAVDGWGFLLGRSSATARL